MKKDISPEEKLLSIIKGSHEKASDDKDGAVAPENSANAKTAGSANRIDDYISIILKNSFFKDNIFNPDVLKTFNKYASITLMLLFLYLLGDIIFVRPSGKARSLVSGFSSGKIPASIAVKNTKVEEKGYSYYSNKIAGRKIFQTGSYSSGDYMDGSQQSGESPESNISLVGIMPGEKPQAIIEDKKEQKTYYLIKGESAHGIKVEDIAQDKVVVEYRGKRVSLFL